MFGLCLQPLLLAAQEKLKAFQTHLKLMQTSTPASVRVCTAIVSIVFMHVSAHVCAGCRFACAIPRAVLPAENKTDPTATAFDRGVVCRTRALVFVYKMLCTFIFVCRKRALLLVSFVRCVQLCVLHECDHSGCPNICGTSQVAATRGQNVNALAIVTAA